MSREFRSTDTPASRNFAPAPTRWEEIKQTFCIGASIPIAFVVFVLVRVAEFAEDRMVDLDQWLFREREMRARKDAVRALANGNHERLEGMEWDYPALADYVATHYADPVLALGELHAHVLNRRPGQHVSDRSKWLRDENYVWTRQLAVRAAWVFPLPPASE